MTKLGELWNALPADEKATYEEDAERRNAEWRIAVDAFRASKGLPRESLMARK